MRLYIPMSSFETDEFFFDLKIVLFHVYSVINFKKLK